MKTSPYSRGIGIRRFPITTYGRAATCEVLAEASAALLNERRNYETAVNNSDAESPFPIRPPSSSLSAFPMTSVADTAMTIAEHHRRGLLGSTICRISAGADVEIILDDSPPMTRRMSRSRHREPPPSDVSPELFRVEDTTGEQTDRQTDSQSADALEILVYAKQEVRFVRVC